MNRRVLSLWLWSLLGGLTLGPFCTSAWSQEKAAHQAQHAFKTYAEISALAISPDGKMLASASHEGIELWDLATGKKKWRLADDELLYCSLAFADEGRTLITVGRQGTLRYRDSTSGKILHEHALIKDPEKWEPTACSLTRNGRFLAIADSTPKTVCVWDLTARKELARIEAGFPYTSGISEDGQYLARVPTMGGPIELWDIPKARHVRTIDPGDPCYLHRLCFSPDGKTLISVGTHLHGTRSWDIATG